MEQEDLSFPLLINSYKNLLAKIFGFFQRIFLELQSNQLKFDLIITIIFVVLWLLFSWQYGFYNSPDSYYRGVLGKSFLEGHPHFINLKQGWLYEFGPWHHDATHEPLLPFLYAIFFLFFGNKIIIANLISTLSAAVLIFPLLRLSRKLFTTIMPAFLIYALVVFNHQLAYMFEVTAGLSIPTLLLMIVLFIYFLGGLLSSNRPVWFWGAALSVVFYYYVRSAAQLIFFWLMFWTSFLTYKLFSKEAFVKLRRMWLVSFALVLPWLLRKFMLFGSPFFSHITPMMWSDRGYNYWSYHEHIPLPSSSAYLKTHTLVDLFAKLFLKGPANFYQVFDRVVWGPFWLYLILFGFAIAVILLKTKEPAKRFVYFLFWAIFLGYFGVYSLVPILEVRYMIPVYFILIFTLVSALFLLAQKQLKILRYLVVGGFVLVFFLSLITGRFSRSYLRFSYHSSDRQLKNDLLIPALKRKINKEEIILGPFADVQRLAFATGLTFIEEPDNLKRLTDPVAFFRKYNIRYSLVDVSQLLPRELIENMEMAGDRVLFTIRRSGGKVLKKQQFFKKTNLLEEPEIKQAIKQGIKNKVVYIDAYHAGEPADLSLFRALGLKAYISYSDFVVDKDRLFQSGLLLMSYTMQQKELSEAEYLILRRFIVNGGRIMLLCPSWVWVTYEKKDLESLPYYKIAKEFGLIFTADSVGKPFKMTNSKFRVNGLAEEIGAVFSPIIYDKGIPILKDNKGRAVAVAAEEGRAKIFAWAQNNFLNAGFNFRPKGKEFIKKVFNWLFEY